MGRRHLTSSEVNEALRNERAVEQWLKHWVDGDERRIQWVRIHFDPREGYGLTVFDVVDEGNTDFIDIYEFHSVDPDEPYGRVQFFESWEEALDSAIKDSGADSNRFVASGIIENEYLDFVKREGFWPA